MGGDPTGLCPGALRRLMGRCGRRAARREGAEAGPVPGRRLLLHGPPAAGTVAVRSWGGAEGGPRPTAAAGPEARARRVGGLASPRLAEGPWVCLCGWRCRGGSPGRSVRGGWRLLLSPVPEHHDAKQQIHLCFRLLSLTPWKGLSSFPAYSENRAHLVFFAQLRAEV